MRLLIGRVTPSEGSDAQQLCGIGDVDHIHRGRDRRGRRGTEGYVELSAPTPAWMTLVTPANGGERPSVVLSALGPQRARAGHPRCSARAMQRVQPRFMRRISERRHILFTAGLLTVELVEASVRTRPDEPDPAPGGSLLERRRWVTIQAAPTRQS